MDFKNKSVLVTGAGAGIGRAAAFAYANCGAKVAVNAAGGGKNSRGYQTVLEIRAAGGTAEFFPGDVSDLAAAKRIVEDTVAAFGGLDILVNNAGVVVPGNIEQISEADYDRMMNINVKGTFLMSKCAVPHMREAGGGVIVNVSSVAGIKGHVDRSIYCASKGAVIALTKAMAADYVGDHIRVNCVCPGTTSTPALEERIRTAADPEKMEAAFMARQPLGRLGEPEEIAQSILFASCDEAGFMDGSVIVIDGGMTM